MRIERLEDRTVLSFIGAPEIAVGRGPDSIAVTDLTGNGRSDVITANFNDDSVSVALSDGDGTFQPARDFPAGHQPESLVVGDFNGDGVPDFAVVNVPSNPNGDAIVSILLGNGDGTFQAPIATDAGAGSWFDTIVTGDVNGDGNLDLITNNRTVLLGNGDGSFRPVNTPQMYGADIALGDFHGDGRLDLITVGGDVGIATMLWRGNGDGTFANPTRVDGRSSYTIAVDDLNHDGIPDLVLGGGPVTTVLLGNGNGSFRAGHMVNVGAARFGVAIADVNGDGNVDLVTANSVALGDGDGTFRGAILSGGLLGPFALRDFNGDKSVDIASAQAQNDSVVIETGNGDGTFRTTPFYSTPGQVTDSVIVGDFTGDGVPDLVVPSDYPTVINVLPGNGDGTFRAPITTSLNFSNYVTVVSGDFNGDGALDLAVATDNFITILPGNGDGTFRHGPSLAVSAVALAVADLNGDGVLDLVSANRDGTVSIFLGNGNGAFDPAQTYATGGHHASAVAVADLNGDKKPDLIVTDDDTDQVSVLLGNGDGTFQQAESYAVASHPTSVAVGSLYGDGIADLVVSSGDTSHINPGTISILRGRGDGTFQDAGAFPMSVVPFSIVLADFNRDGILDLAVDAGGSLQIQLGRGDGTFGPAERHSIDYDSFAMVAGDLNGDGFPDLVLSDINGGATVFLNAADWTGPHGSPVNRPRPSILSLPQTSQPARTLRSQSDVILDSFNSLGSDSTATPSVETVGLSQQRNSPALISRPMSWQALPDLKLLDSLSEPMVASGLFDS